MSENFAKVQTKTQENILKLRKNLQNRFKTALI